jgi:hypothetical protein
MTLEGAKMSAHGYESACNLVEHNYQQFRQLVGDVETHLQRGRADAAAVCAQMVANFAMSRHAGLFASPALEDLLLTIGRKHLASAPKYTRRTVAVTEPRHVLHVLTRAAGVGGDTRLVARWVRHDPERTHSVVLTRQGAGAVPALLSEAVADSGGTLHILNERRGSFLAWASALREIAFEADLVVLHIHPYDIIPSLAFADPANRAPVIYVNHADHVFWAGVGVCDAVVNRRGALREPARDPICSLHAPADRA